MCESHVSNPQTVGKCCSLLNSLLPPSLLPSLSLSFRWTALQASALPRSNPARVCVHACVSVCARVYDVCLPASQHTGSERRESASGAPPGTATSCRQFLCQYQALQHTHTCKHTHAHTHMHAQPAQLLIGNCKMSQEGGRLLSNSVSLCVDLCIPFPSRCLFLLNTNTEIFHCERAAFIALRIRSSCSLTFSDACQQSQRVATNNKFSIQP